MIRMDGLQYPVDLVLAVLAAGLEPFRDVREERLAAISRDGDRLEASVPEESGELGRSVERRAADIVAFRSLHPCDDTRPCLL